MTQKILHLLDWLYVQDDFTILLISVGVFIVLMACILTVFSFAKSENVQMDNEENSLP